MDKNEIEQILRHEAEAVLNIPVTDGFGKATEILHRQVHQLGGKVIMSGMGKAGQIGANIATTLASTGTPAFFLHPSEAQHGDLGIVQPDDVLILISN